jgi:hypothetical protein
MSWTLQTVWLFWLRVVLTDEVLVQFQDADQTGTDLPP